MSYPEGLTQPNSPWNMELGAGLKLISPKMTGRTEPGALERGGRKVASRSRRRPGSFNGRQDLVFPLAIMSEG
jgi:hypothetical protein